MKSYLTRYFYRLICTVASLAILTGCLDDESYRFDTPPTATPEGISFVDTNLGYAIGGVIEIDRALDESGFSSYVIRWAAGGAPAGGDDGTLPNGDSDVIGIINKNRSTLRYFLPDNTQVPPGVDGMVAIASNALGDATTYAWTSIDNLIHPPRTDATRIQNLSFSDTYNSASISGLLQFSPASDETDITHYVIRFADKNGCPIPGAPIKKIPTGDTAVIEHHINRMLPPTNATDILVLSANELGEHPEADCANHVNVGANWNYIDFSLRANYAPSNIEVTDVNNKLALRLKVKVSPAFNELDIRSYGVYLGDIDNCTYLGSIPKGGGTKYFNVSFNEFAQYRIETQSSYNYRDFYNRYITVTSDGEPCSNPHPYYNHPRYRSKFIEEKSGTWYLIYNVDWDVAEGIKDFFSIFPKIFDNDYDSSWKAKCLQADGDDLKVADCRYMDGRQRFEVTDLKDTSNNDLHKIKSLHNEKCFHRTDDGGEHDWKLSDCSNVDEQKMELKGRNQDYDNKKIAVSNFVWPVTHWSCATSHRIRDDVFGTWGNCDGGIGIFWQFWKMGYASRIDHFNDNTNDPH